MSRYTGGQDPKQPNWYKRLAIYGSMLVAFGAGCTELAHNFKDVLEVFSARSTKSEAESELGCRNCSLVIKGNGNTIVLNSVPGESLGPIESVDKGAGELGQRTDAVVIPFEKRLQLDELASIRVPDRERMARKMVETQFGTILALMPELIPQGPIERQSTPVPLPRPKPWVYYGIRIEAQGDNAGEVIIKIEVRSCQLDRPPECFLLSDMERWKHPVFIDP